MSNPQTGYNNSLPKGFHRVYLDGHWASVKNDENYLKCFMDCEVKCDCGSCSGLFNVEAGERYIVRVKENYISVELGGPSHFVRFPYECFMIKQPKNMSRLEQIE